MFLKTLQNGNPVLMAYKIIPYSQEQNNSSNNMDKESGEELQTLKNRVEEIEKKLLTIKNNSTGGSLLEYT